MPTLSFEDSKGARAVALVRGGDFDGEILYLHEDDVKPKRKPKKEISAVKYNDQMKHLRPAERVALMNRLQEAMRKGVSAEALKDEPENVRVLYKRIEEDEKKDTSIVLPDDSTFNLIVNPDPEKREVWYIAGASGSGKSYIARQLAESYKKLFPSREVYLISKLEEDSTLDTMKIGKPKRINVNTLVEDYPKLEEFEDCMVIFDDFDTFTGAESKAVLQLIDDLAIQGRHTKTTMLVLTHYITNYKKTRLILNESTHFVVYPQATSAHALGYLLKTHIGMEKEEVKALKKLGRWVCVAKNYPQHLISAHTAKILHTD